MEMMANKPSPEAIKNEIAEGQVWKSIFRHGVPDTWPDDNAKAFRALFGAGGGRYSAAAEKVVALRSPHMKSDAGVTYAGVLPGVQSTSGQPAAAFR